MIEIYTRIVGGLPYKVKGLVLPCEDGYCIYINEDIPREDKIATYEHELEHIRAGHLDDDCCVAEAEWEIA